MRIFVLLVLCGIGLAACGTSTGFARNLDPLTADRHAIGRWAVGPALQQSIGDALPVTVIDSGTEPYQRDDDSAAGPNERGAGVARAEGAATASESPSDYGASKVGPTQEPAETEGEIVDDSNYPDAINGAEAGAVLLIRGGTYSSGFTAPGGVTVKPYNAEKVTIKDRIYVDGSHVTLAGLYIDATGRDWALRLSGPGRNITLRHMALKGGDKNVVRLDGDMRKVRITGSDLGHGGGNTLKAFDGKNYRIINNVFHDSGEDDIQLEHHLSVRIKWNTFRNNPSENAIDVKEVLQPGAGVTISHNYFDGSTIDDAALLVQGGFANNIVEHNYFDHGDAVLGAHPEFESDPWWRFENNVVVGAEIRLRRSFDAEILNNVVRHGSVKLGLGGDDIPRDALILGNTFDNVGLVDRTDGDFDCRDNVFLSIPAWQNCT